MPNMCISAGPDYILACYRMKRYDPIYDIIDIDENNASEHLGRHLTGPLEDIWEKRKMTPLTHASLKKQSPLLDAMPLTTDTCRDFIIPCNRSHSDSFRLAMPGW